MALIKQAIQKYFTPKWRRKSDRARQCNRGSSETCDVTLLYNFFIDLSHLTMSMVPVSLW